MSEQNGNGVWEMKRVFDDYDYERIYDKQLDLSTGELLEEVVRPQRGVAYTTATIKSGNQFEVEIYPSFRHQIPDMIRRHKEKKRESRECQKNLNDRHAKKKLFRLVHENFYPGDYWCTFTFAEEPKDLETAEKLCKNFFRRINRVRKKKGLENAKYVYIIEEAERLHLHLVMDNGLSKQEVELKWGLGFSHIQTLNYYKDENFMGICEYMVKERKNIRLKGKKRWGSSKGNLVLPKPSKNRTKLSKKKVMDMVLNQDSIGERLEREYPNYNFKEVEIRYNDWNGLFYIYARMQSKKWNRAFKRP